MVTTITPRDIGGDIGRSIGGGFGDAMKMLTQRQMQQGGLDQLQKTLREKYQEQVEDPETGEISYKQKSNIDPLEMIIDMQKGTAGIPGLSQSFTENLAPLLLKRAQSKASTKAAFGDLEQEVFPEGTNLPRGLQEKLTKLSNAATGRRGEFDAMGEDLMAVVPKFGEQAPAYGVPSLAEMAKSSQEMAALGASPGEIYAAQQQKVQQGLQSYKADRQGWEDKVKEFSMARGLEEQQLNFLSGPAQQGGRISNWLADNKIDNSQFWHDQGYRAFQTEKKKNPDFTDEKLWVESKAHLDNLKNLEARGRKDAAKPWLIPGLQNNKARDSFQNSKKFAESYYKMAGNTPETRERLKSILAENGWDEDYVLAIAQSPSKGLETWFDSVQPLPRSSSAMSAAQAGDIGKKQQAGMDIIMDTVSDLVGDRPVAEDQPARKPMLGPTDSILLLRNRLVREKNLNKFQANEVIKEIGNRGFLSEPQQSEIPMLEQSVKIMPMYDIFTEAVER